MKLKQTMDRLLKALVSGSALKTALTYFTVALIVFLSAYGFPQEGANASLEVIPIRLSIILLVPLYVWYKRYTSRAKLSKEVNGRTKTTIVFWILIIFALAMAVRIPSVILFDMPYEKTPLIFLVILTIVLLEKTDASAFGFKLQNIGTSLLKGAALYLVFGGSMLLSEYLLIQGFTGQPIVISFDTLAFLSAIPFHTLCVGISEEGFFRGYMQTHLEKHYTFRKAILIQALAFGVWHFVWNISPFNPLDMAVYIATTCFWGLLVGYFYGKSRNLIPLFLTHGLWNSAIAGLLTNKAAQDALERTSIPNQISVAFLPYIISGILTFALIKYFVKEN
jgi:membrane protease YdiL (CAAX protease family)